jgi:hypothetical protein
MLHHENMPVRACRFRVDCIYICTLKPTKDTVNQSSIRITMTAARKSDVVRAEILNNP